MSLSIMSMTNEDLTRFANQVKDVLAEKTGINLDGFVVVVSEPSYLGKFINKMVRAGEKRASIFVLRTLEEDDG